MGDFSMTCSVSGLGISGGTKVRCLLLTGSPYNDDPRNAWVIRTPPIRAEYNSYGSIENIHPDDKFITDLWLRGLKEDLVEKGLGDNSCHDVPATKDMSFDELLDAIQERRVQVRQDVEHFWRRPRKLDLLDRPVSKSASFIPDLRSIEAVLAQDVNLTKHFKDPVSRGAAENKFVVDEPVPRLVRVRFGHYQHGQEVTGALNVAKEAIERAGFVGVIAAGSGRYPDDEDLLVLPKPNPKDHVHGPQWDMASGQSADHGKRLPVSMAMIREDVWQALCHYPHSDPVTLDCTNCGQQYCYHGAKLQCPNKSINDKPYKKHPKGSIYAHGPVFPDGVEHIVIPRDYGETVWYDISAFKANVRKTWQDILDRFSDKPKKKQKSEKPDPQVERMMRDMEAARKKEADRVAKLPAEERAKIKAEQAAWLEAYKADQKEKADNPHFGDFDIKSAMMMIDQSGPGAWLFHDSTPGVIGLPAHLSMCIADKKKVPVAVLDAIAELAVVSHVIAGVGVTWKPAISSGPQYPEWDQNVRFYQTVLNIAKAELKEQQEQDEDSERKEVYSHLHEVKTGGSK